MKWQRRMTSTPGQLVSTINAVIWSFGFPFTILGGVLAMTTITPALVPLVHHNFSPLRIKTSSPGCGTALVDIADGSEPTRASVNANAEISPRATRQVLFLLRFGAEQDQRLRHANGLMG